MSSSQSSARALWTAGALVAVAVGISAAAYPHLPATVATHWDVHGTPNGYSSRIVAVLIGPVLMTFLTVVLIVAPRADAGLFVRYRDRASSTSTVRPVYSTIALITIAFSLAVHVVMLAVGARWLSAAVAPRIGAALLSLLFIALGNYMPRVTERNALIGVRLPWTFASDEVWRRTQRAGGYAMVAAGLLGLIAVFAAPAHAFSVVLFAVLAMLVGVVVYSYWLARAAG